MEDDLKSDCVKDPEIIRAVLEFRRGILLSLAAIEKILGRFDPVCRRCFYERALLDVCRCPPRAA